jgi:hypothetical protein
VNRPALPGERERESPLWIEWLAKVQGRPAYRKAIEKGGEFKPAG